MALTTIDIYMRYTGADGKKHVKDHRVWDASRFVAARSAEAKRLNAEEKDEAKRNHYAEQITEEQYRAERAPR